MWRGLDQDGVVCCDLVGRGLVWRRAASRRDYDVVLRGMAWHGVEWPFGMA